MALQPGFGMPFGVDTCVGHAETYTWSGSPQGPGGKGKWVAGVVAEVAMDHANSTSVPVPF